MTRRKKPSHVREKEFLYILAKRRDPPPTPGYLIEPDHGIADYDLRRGYAWLIKHYDPMTGIAIYDLVMWKPLARYVAIPINDEESNRKYLGRLHTLEINVLKKYDYISKEAVAERFMSSLYAEIYGLREWVKRGW